VPGDLYKWLNAYFAVQTKALIREFILLPIRGTYYSFAPVNAEKIPYILKETEEE
jgi:hypothetical protein